MSIHSMVLTLDLMKMSTLEESKDFLVIFVVHLGNTLYFVTAHCLLYCENLLKTFLCLFFNLKMFDSFIYLYNDCHLS